MFTATPKHMHRVVVAAALSLGCLSSRAAYVAITGMAPIGAMPPAFPVNAQQCELFAEDAAERRAQLIRWHDECLQANRAKSVSALRKGAECSTPACEGFHRARDSYSRQAADETSACFAAVTAARSEIAKSLATKERAKAAQSALLSGPFAAAMTWTKEHLAEMFKSRLFDADRIGKGIDAAKTVNEVISPLAELRQTCMSRVPVSAGAHCEKQVMLSINDLAALATDPERGNPTIGLIQRAMFERLNLQNLETLRQLRLGFGPDKAADSDEGGSIGR